MLRVALKRPNNMGTPSPLINRTCIFADPMSLCKEDVSFLYTYSRELKWGCFAGLDLVMVFLLILVFVELLLEREDTPTLTKSNKEEDSSLGRQISCLNHSIQLASFIARLAILLVITVIFAGFLAAQYYYYNSEYY